MTAAPENETLHPVIFDTSDPRFEQEWPQESDYINYVAAELEEFSTRNGWEQCYEWQNETTYTGNNVMLETTVSRDHEDGTFNVRSETTGENFEWPILHGVYWREVMDPETRPHTSTPAALDPSDFFDWHGVLAEEGRSDRYTDLHSGDTEDRISQALDGFMRSRMGRFAPAANFAVSSPAIGAWTVDVGISGLADVQQAAYYVSRCESALSAVVDDLGPALADAIYEALTVQERAAIARLILEQIAETAEDPEYPAAERLAKLNEETK